MKYVRKYCLIIKTLLLVFVASDIIQHIAEVVLHPKDFLSNIPLIMGIGLLGVIFQLIRKGSRFGLIFLFISSVFDLFHQKVTIYPEYYPVLQEFLLIGIAILSSLHLINFFYIKRKFKVEPTEAEKKSIRSLITAFFVLYILIIIYVQVTTTDWRSLFQVSHSQQIAMSS